MIVTRQKANKDYLEDNINKGEFYYKWKFRYDPKIYRSKKYPERSQLTQSSFLSQLYSLEDSFEFTRGDLENSVAELIDNINELLEQCQSSLDAIPEQLQETGSSGQLLQERIDALENWISELESIDLEIDDDLTEEEREIVIDAIISELEGIKSSL